MIGALPYGSDQLIDTRMARSVAAVTKLTLGPLKVLTQRSPCQIMTVRPFILFRASVMACSSVSHWISTISVTPVSWLRKMRRYNATAFLPVLWLRAVEIEQRFNRPLSMKAEARSRKARASKALQVWLV